MSTVLASNLAGPSSTGTAATLASVNGGPISGARNRIINGDMRIDQRNAGASVTVPTNGNYTVDRYACLASLTSKYSIQQNAGAVTPPSGYSNYVGATSLSAYAVTSTDYFGIEQRIEGLNISDLGWGAAGASSVTLSFWVRSSLTGTFGGAINNAVNRSYPFTYTISSANTWEQKAITIPGDTTGTWLTTNGIGFRVILSFGAGSTYVGTAGTWQAGILLSATGATSVVGTNAATFYITGVQLEAGTVATPFERRSYGQELALCQRYYEKSYSMSKLPGDTTDGTTSGANFLAVDVVSALGTATFKVSKRAIPTITLYSPTTGTASRARDAAGGADAVVSSVGDVTDNGFFRFSGTWTAGRTYSVQYTASIEL